MIKPTHANYTEETYRYGDLPDRLAKILQGYRPDAVVQLKPEQTVIVREGGTHVGFLFPGWSPVPPYFLDDFDRQIDTDETAVVINTAKLTRLERRSMELFETRIALNKALSELSAKE